MFQSLRVLTFGTGQSLLSKAQADSAAHNLLTTRIDQLKPNLIAQIGHDLSFPEIRKTNTAKLVTLLTRLDQADLARDIFLKTRRDIMLKRVRGIKCEGDISIYISELAIVCFTTIRHSSDWFMGAFKDSRMASGMLSSELARRAVA